MAIAPVAPAATIATPTPKPGSTTENKGATAPATSAEIRKMKLKLDGNEVELPESEVIARAQRSTMSEKRFQEASAMKKQAEDILKFAKENPKEFFKRTGMNAREWAENYLIEQLKAEQMTPEQKKAAENEEKLRQYESEKKKTADDKLAADRAEMQAKHVENYNKLFVEALGKAGLPKTAYTVKRMAELQLVNIKKNLELTHDQLAKVVREDYIAEQKALFEASEGDQLLEMLGPDVVKKLSKAQISKLKSKGNPTASSSSTAQRQSGPQALSWREYQKRNRGRI